MPGVLALVAHWYDDCGPSLCIVHNGIAVGFLEMNESMPGFGAYKTAPFSAHDPEGARAYHDNPETVANMLLVGLGLRRAV